jgi:hypothetical protein
MKFVNNETGFAFGNWSVSIYRRRVGNRLDGRRYDYTFDATKLERQGDQWAIIAKVKGNGQKQSAIAAIKGYDLGVDKVV